MSKLRAGIIGLGVGEQHITGYQSHWSCEVTALCDFSTEKCTMARRKYPEMAVFENCEAILDNPDIDIVSIASYDNYHYEQIIKAIETGKHIFVEKPLCLYEWQASHIRTLLRDNPHIKLSSNLVLRKSKRFAGLKELIDNGRLGQIYYVEADYNYGRLHKITEGWRGSIDFYSVVYGGGVHIIDLLLWLTGERVSEVCAYGNNISTHGSKFKYNDIVVGILKFESGVTGKIACNFSCVYPHFHNLLIYGTDATFVNDFEKARLFCSRDATVKAKEIGTSYCSVHKGELIHNFVDSIVTGSEPEITVGDIFDSMSVCFAIEKSSIGNGAVEVKYI